MTKKERFINVLRTFERPVTLSEWTNRIIEYYPVVLNQINSQTNELMTPKALASTLKRKVSRGEYPEVKIVDLGSYRDRLYMVKNNQLNPKKEFKDITKRRLERRREKTTQKYSAQEKYRFEEFNTICRQLNKYFGVDFKIDYAASLSHTPKRGRDYLEQIQLLTKEHSQIKKDDAKRFSIEEQKAYIKRVISVQMMLDRSMEIHLTDDILEMLLDRLEKVYG
jgi:hypothetical protein